MSVSRARELDPLSGLIHAMEGQFLLHAELQLLLSKLSVRERTLALLDAATGLRVSEFLAFAGVMSILRT
jgi:hypothetical protein